MTTSAGLQAARDAVAADPRLLGPEVDRLFEAAINRLRQRGEPDLATKMEFWRTLLRTFREHGIQDGYIRLVVDELATSQSVEQILTTDPDLSNEQLQLHLRERIDHAVDLADAAAWHRLVILSVQIEAYYSGQVVNAAQAHGQVVNAANVGELVAMANQFISEPELETQRQLLAAHPELLTSLALEIIEALVKHLLHSAAMEVDVSAVRRLRLTHALAVHSERAGVDVAFQAMTRGETLPELLTWM